MIIVNIEDLIHVLSKPYEYPIGSEMFNSYSIYANIYTYVIYNIIFIIFLILLLFFHYKKKKLLFIIFIIVCIFLFLYPLLTNGNDYLD